MGGLEAVIADGAGGGKSDVHDGGPALEFVVAVVVEQIGNADGRCGAGGLDDGESRMIIDDVVGEQNFLAAAATHIQGGEIIECTGSGYTGKEPAVGCVPKGMFVRGRDFRLWRRGAGRRGHRSWIRRGRRFLGKEPFRAARGSEREQQYEWNCAQPLDSGPVSSIVVVFSHHSVREYHRRIRVVFYLVCAGVFRRNRGAALASSVGRALHAVVLVPQDTEAGRVAKRPRLGGLSLGHRQECLCYCAREVAPVASFARPNCWWFARRRSRRVFWRLPKALTGLR